MRIAILGATSEIAKDLIISFSLHDNSQDLVLYCRRPEAIHEWLVSIGLQERYLVDHLDNFEKHPPFDAIINFIGSGDPAKTALIGAEILDITEKFDFIVLEYLRVNSKCKYIFLSSGAVYGDSFEQPVNEISAANIPINEFTNSYYYGSAKLAAELRHRTNQYLAIIDIRLFNYFSHTQDINSRYLISDLCRAITTSSEINTSEIDIHRDFIGSVDFYHLIMCILLADPINIAVDCYSLAPVSKLTLLKTLQSRFGLRYKLISEAEFIGLTGSKPFYYSLNRKASQLGYSPSLSSLEMVISEVDILLSRDHQGLSKRLNGG